jgi:death-on-curing protein
VTQLPETTFLTFEEVLYIHADQIAQYGGSAGVRDEGLLRSALAQPEAMFGDQYLHDSLAAQTAAYLFHLVKNHPFVDGNKRAGTACALVFLEINGHELDPWLDGLHEFTGQTHLETVVVQVASGDMSKDDLIAFIRGHIRQLNPIP